MPKPVVLFLCMQFQKKMAPRIRAKLLRDFMVSSRLNAVWTHGPIINTAMQGCLWLCSGHPHKVLDGCLGPCLVGGIITLENASFTTKIAVHSGANALAPYGCVALLDTGSPHTFIRRDVLDRMLSVGAASVACEGNCAPRSWGGFGESVPL